MHCDYTMMSRSAVEGSYAEPVPPRDWATRADEARIVLRSRLESELAEAREEATSLGEPALTRETETRAIHIGHRLIDFSLWYVGLRVSASATDRGEGLLILENRGKKCRLTLAVPAQGALVRTMVHSDSRVEQETVPESSLSELVRWLARG